MPRSQTLTVRVSSKGQIAVPKPIREKLGIAEGTDLAIRVEGEDLVLRKVSRQSWRSWQGRLKGSPLLKDLAAERRNELKKDAKGS